MYNQKPQSQIPLSILKAFPHILQVNTLFTLVSLMLKTDGITFVHQPLTCTAKSTMYYYFPFFVAYLLTFPYETESLISHV